MLLGAWFGLLVGFVEVGHETIRERVFGSVLHHKSADFVWMTPVSYLVMGLATGFLLGVIARFAPRVVTVRVAAFALASLGAWSQLLAYPSLHGAAVLALALGVAWQCSRSWALGCARTLGWARRSTRWMLMVVVAAAAVATIRRPVAEQLEMASLPAAPAGAKNVVLIVLDTVRADHLSTYGYRRKTSPNLDALSLGGVTFENCLSTSPWTLPAHVTMFTGRYQHEIDADWLKPFGDRYPTLAEAMAARGYATGGFVGNLGYCGRQNGIDRGFHRYEDFYVQLDVLVFSSLVGQRVGRWLLGDAFGTALRNDAETVTTRFLGWTRELEGRPFFAFLNYYDAHETYLPPEEFDRFDPNDDPGSRYGLDEKPEVTRRFAADYDGCIAYIDHQLGRLIAELDAAGTLDETVLIVTGDHGEMFFEQGLHGHGHSLYRPLVQVPLVMWSKGGVPKRRRIKDWVTISDLPATVFELSGVAPDGAFPGQSLSQFWRPAGPAEERSPLLAEVSQGIAMPSFTPVSGGDMKSLIEGSLQFITGGNRGDALYDLIKDPRQEINMIDSAPGRRAAARMRATIQRIVGDN